MPQQPTAAYWQIWLLDNAPIALDISPGESTPIPSSVSPGENTPIAGPSHSVTDEELFLKFGK